MLRKFLTKLANQLNYKLDTLEGHDVAYDIVVAAAVICDSICEVIAAGDDDADS
jgi:hypothetical protein